MIDAMTYLRLRCAYITQQANRGDDLCQKIVIAKKIYANNPLDINKQALIALIDQYRAVTSFPQPAGRQ